MNWKFAGDRPVYQQIMAAIRGAILKGELPRGEKSPPSGIWPLRRR